MNSTVADEQNAEALVRSRDQSDIGIDVAAAWAKAQPKGAEVIEIGCGGGVPVSKTLVDAGLKLWAIDSSPTLIRIFKDRFPNVPARCESATDSSYFGQKFDAAIAIGLVFLLPERDQIELIRRVSKILRPGSSFLFTAPLQVGTWDDTLTGHGCLSLGEERYVRALRDNGFENIRTHTDAGDNNYYEVEKPGGEHR